MHVVGILTALLLSTAPASAQIISPYKYVITHMTVTDLQTLSGPDSLSNEVVGIDHG